MTDQISKAREVLERFDNLQVASPESTFAWCPSMVFSDEDAEIIRKSLTAMDTLSSIDAERLGEAIAHVEKIDAQMRELQIYPPCYSMSVPVDDCDSDMRVKQVCEAAATLHGLVRGE